MLVLVWEWREGGVDRDEGRMGRAVAFGLDWLGS